MKFNSKTNSLKGHVFDPANPDSMPSFTRAMNPTKQKEWAERETERYAVIRNCPTCDEPLIAEEATAHILNHAPTALRPLARMLVELSKEDRAELNKIIKAVTK